MRVIIVTLMIIGSFLYSAQITLIDGTTITGEIISSSDAELQIKVTYSDDLLTINRNQVLDINFKGQNETYSRETSQSTTLDFYPAATKINLAGQSLENFRSQYYTGFWIQVASIGFMFMSRDDSGFIIAIMGNLIGSVVQLMAFSHAGEAGEELSRLKKY